MLIERNINAVIIVDVDVIMNQAEYQYEIWSLKSSRRKSRTVRQLWFVYARILLCFPISSTLHLFVNAKKLLNKKKFNLNCRERIRQSIRKKKHHASRYLTLFSCNKLMCSCKSKAHAMHVTNYCNYKVGRDIDIRPAPPTYVELISCIPRQKAVTGYTKNSKP